MASSVNEDEEPEWVLARQGINLLINNMYSESEALLLRQPDSLVMYSGYSFVVFMDALMSFEEEKLSKAILVLKEVERRCTTKNGWFKSISQKVFGTGNDSSLSEQLETQIILADSQVCLAVLTFLHQDLTGYFKGGWVLRKAWKVYQRTYKDILTMYKSVIGELQLPDPISAPLTPSTPMNSTEADLDWDVPEPEINGYPQKIPHSFSLNFQNQAKLAEPEDFTVNSNKKKLKKSNSVTDALNRSSRFGLNFPNTLSLTHLTSSLREIFPGQTEPQIVDRNAIVRLMGAVSFGYGLFQLGVSLLPPSLTKLISLLGFAANKQNGVACLMYARLGVDMRAPLASLSLLWYHTIVRPFYAVDGINVQAGVEAATTLIEESQKEFSDSALFLFFAGRAYRLNSKITDALASFQKANDNANHREIKMLCLHEIGWCHLIQLDYQEARNTFVYLKHTSRWSRSFYVYLAAICIGSMVDFANYSIFGELQKTPPMAGQLDEFLTRRLHVLPEHGNAAKKLNGVFFKLLVFEMLYLWNAMPSCSDDMIQTIINDCSLQDNQDEPRPGLAALITGSCYTIQKNFPKAIDSFRNCLDQRKNEPTNSEDAHISAFAQYELGNILTQTIDTKDEGKCLLQNVSKYERYDCEARLTVRIHSLLRQL